MLRLPRFSYLRPGSAAEAAQLLAEHGSQARLVAGGTDLLPKMKRGQVEPEVLVGLGHLGELRQVRARDDGGFDVGAGVTLSEVGAHPQLRAAYRGYVRASALVSSPALRNAGTIGGNLCVDTRCNYYDMSYEWRQAVGFCMKKDGDICRVAPASATCRAIASSDTAPVAIALGASVVLVGPEGEREVPVASLYQDDGQFYLTKADDEVLVSLRLPKPDGWRSSYVKVRSRDSIDFPVVGVAAAMKMTGPVVEACRIVLTAVGPQPLDVSGAAEALLGRELDDAAVEEVALQAAKPARPLDNADLGYVWRKRMTRIAIEQAIWEARTTSSTTSSRPA
ncbi:MAG: FAD binding domain-containing protein [Acidimicrobiales bacterium]|jgi:4-hydroxybenzoyl-CoA reductase subunit beta